MGLGVLVVAPEHHTSIAGIIAACWIANAAPVSIVPVHARIAAMIDGTIMLGFDQAQLIEGHRRELVCGAVDTDGNPQHPGDMAAQLDLALDNLQAVLAAAEMTFANIVRLNVYTTDVDELLKHWARLPDRFGNSDGRFVTTVLGVTRLAAPPLLVLLEATAVD